VILRLKYESALFHLIIEKMNDISENFQDSSADVKVNDLFKMEDRRIKLAVKNLVTYQSVGNRKVKQLKKNIADQISVDVNYLSDNLIDIYTFPSPRCVKISPINSLMNQNFSSSSSSSSQIFRLMDVSGFYIIRNIINESNQYFWVKECVKNLSQSEYTNLTNLKRLNSSSSDQNFNNIENNWRLGLEGLRWVSLGYHYNWTLRKYEKDMKSNLPSKFSDLCRDIASLVGLSLKPEAGIINFYPQGSQMGGHLDDAEHCMDEPIVSISLGCSAIFMIGGRDKCVKPVPILLRSGDAIIMSGESRYFYHGISCLIPPGININSTLPSTSFDHSDSTYSSEFIKSDEKYDLEDDEEERFIRHYMKWNRINMNVRRVTRQDGLWEDKNGSGYEPSNI
jgi:alkylated DNA repair protein alkB family protein 1